MILCYFLTPLNDSKRYATSGSGYADCPQEDKELATVGSLPCIKLATFDLTWGIAHPGCQRLPSSNALLSLNYFCLSSTNNPVFHHKFK